MHPHKQNHVSSGEENVEAWWSDPSGRSTCPENDCSMSYTFGVKSGERHYSTEATCPHEYKGVPSPMNHQHTGFWWDDSLSCMVQLSNSLRFWLRHWCRVCWNEECWAAQGFLNVHWCRLWRLLTPLFVNVASSVHNTWHKKSGSSAVLAVALV
jgi:hypothetical protein